MEVFNELRKLAREKRDKAIHEAKGAYEATLARIAALEQDLLGRDLSSHKTIAACIDSVVPTDRPFTTQDIIAGLEAIDPRRNWRKRSIDSHIARLRERGLVRRVRKSQNTSPAVYVRVGVAVEAVPFEDMTLPEVVAKVLSERQPLRTAELTVAMLEAGYQTTMTAKNLRAAVGVVLRKHRRFRETKGTWAVGEKDSAATHASF
jgi:DNA-binding transcriptional ArsR family regulator